jgi:hypothetical protein
VPFHRQDIWLDMRKQNTAKQKQNFWLKHVILLLASKILLSTFLVLPQGLLVLLWALSTFVFTNQESWFRKPIL